MPEPGRWLPKRFYDRCKQKLQAAGPSRAMVCTPGSILCLHLSRPWTLDATGHECLLLFRDARIGIGFCGSCHPACFASGSGCEERILSHGKPDVLGGGLCDPSISMAASMTAGGTPA